MNTLPQPIAWDEYEELVIKEFQSLLDSNSNEAAFQEFFEINPSFIRGAYQLDGETSHGPYMDTLISQPKISWVCNKYPDFLWLANDSRKFVPVFIEIKKPSLKTLNIAEPIHKSTQSADLTAAFNQITMWKVLLGKLPTRQLFYDEYAIPQSLRDMDFVPQFGLIYGRRKEYEDNNILKSFVDKLAPNGIYLMSYDSLKPKRDYASFTCTTVSEANYNIKNIPPTFTYNNNNKEYLSKLNKFKDAIPKMNHTTNERKTFLSNNFEIHRDNASIKKEIDIFSVIPNGMEAE